MLHVMSTHRKTQGPNERRTSEEEYSFVVFIYVYVLASLFLFFLRRSGGRGDFYETAGLRLSEQRECLLPLPRLARTAIRPISALRFWMSESLTQT